MVSKPLLNLERLRLSDVVKAVSNQTSFVDYFL